MFPSSTRSFSGNWRRCEAQDFVASARGANHPLLHEQQRQCVASHLARARWVVAATGLHFALPWTPIIEEGFRCPPQCGPFRQLARERRITLCRANHSSASQMDGRTSPFHFGTLGHWCMRTDVVLMMRKPRSGCGTRIW